MHFHLFLRILLSYISQASGTAFLSLTLFTPTLSSLPSFTSSTSLVRVAADAAATASRHSLLEEAIQPIVRSFGLHFPLSETFSLIR